MAPGGFVLGTSCLMLSLSSVKRDGQSNNDDIFRAAVSFIPAMYTCANAQMAPGPSEELF